MRVINGQFLEVGLSANGGDDHVYQLVLGARDDKGFGDDVGVTAFPVMRWRFGEVERLGGRRDVRREGVRRRAIQLCPAWRECIRADRPQPPVAPRKRMFFLKVVVGVMVMRDSLVELGNVSERNKK